MAAWFGPNPVWPNGNGSVPYPPAPRLKRSLRDVAQSALPWRSSLPGVAPVQSPSSKVTWPFTMMFL